MPSVIKVENLSKAYHLGEIGTGTISRDLERFWAKVRGKDDPFLKIGETNDRSKKGKSDVVWSLKDLDFDIAQGDAVGIIGRNGAGKSTLLKILSRITSPTSGSVKIKGRIASLLEVGTGFHPELTGRENIYLNGAILGMRKAEIKRKFDEIVDFSGVERYIDTPVKRYSSGMYVRLAFAVAAHLESEIMIVDEVLAVGDAEFQKKCLGKMADVSKVGNRTVLFVSHNMGAINQLCNNAIYLHNGSVAAYGDKSAVIENYLTNNTSNYNRELSVAFDEQESDEDTCLNSFEIYPHFADVNDFLTHKDIEVAYDVRIIKPAPGLRIGFEIMHHATEQCVFRSFHDDSYETASTLEQGNLRLSGIIPANLLNKGEYIVYPIVGLHNEKWLCFHRYSILINLVNIGGVNKLYAENRPGIMAPSIDWNILYETN
ncbi:ABC transporter ATP-binding protein [Mucilaginibacter corticis]|uniref:ABC transporter ATP-binding protein n=1 Tax=Mucilaginibacter corticis TaxID=2597670 RepID=A0A556M7R8_9SPHI|nr:ABC transporter ATP-binding protein [Mucilaginibacter corticis]TSJ35958.1 ABC transporter ATP-binding protein [Mucilaginibacter corticis]